MQAQITQAVRSALEGSRKVKITFKPGATSDVNYLLGMCRNGIIRLNGGDEMLMMAVAETGDWEDDANRTLTLTLTESFDESWFVGRMRRALEKIEAVN